MTVPGLVAGRVPVRLRDRGEFVRALPEVPRREVHAGLVADGPRSLPSLIRTTAPRWRAAAMVSDVSWLARCCDPPGRRQRGVPLRPGHTASSGSSTISSIAAVSSPELTRAASSASCSASPRWGASGSLIGGYQRPSGPCRHPARCSLTPPGYSSTPDRSQTSHRRDTRSMRTTLAPLTPSLLDPPIRVTDWLAVEQGVRRDRTGNPSGNATGNGSCRPVPSCPHPRTMLPPSALLRLGCTRPRRAPPRFPPLRSPRSLRVGGGEATAARWPPGRPGPCAVMCDTVRDQNRDRFRDRGARRSHSPSRWETPRRATRVVT